MLTILSFLLMTAGCINWLLIGLLQYDFVAGIFGYQGSVFSRIIYILIGASCFLFIFKIIKGKGTVNIFSRRNKADVAKNIAKMQKKPAPVEAGKEEIPNPLTQDDTPGQDYADEPPKKESGLINEHFHEE